MAISSNCYLVTAGSNEVVVQNLRGVLPSRYYDDVCISFKRPNVKWFLMMNNFF